MKNKVKNISRGGCLCGQLRYVIRGIKRDVIVCHCENCRRSHGHAAAYTAVYRDQLEFENQQSLDWFYDKSPGSMRGFCKQCGSSLFWYKHLDSEKISVAAGSLDDASDLKTIGHIYLDEKGEYYEITDELPVFARGSNGRLD